MKATPGKLTALYLGGFAAALGAALSFGGAQVLTSVTVNTISPFVILAVGQVIAVFINGAIFSRNVVRDRGGSRKAYVASLAAGLTTTVALALVFNAFKYAPVIVVSPIMAGAVPIFAIILGAVFLRRAENLTRTTALGAGMVIAGAVLVTIARSL